MSCRPAPRLAASTALRAPLAALALAAALGLAACADGPTAPDAGRARASAPDPRVEPRFGVRHPSRTPPARPAFGARHW